MEKQDQEVIFLSSFIIVVFVRQRKDYLVWPSLENRSRNEERRFIYTYPDYLHTVCIFFLQRIVIVLLEIKKTRKLYHHHNFGTNLFQLDIKYLTHKSWVKSLILVIDYSQWNFDIFTIIRNERSWIFVPTVSLRIGNFAGPQHCRTFELNRSQKICRLKA